MVDIYQRSEMFRGLTNGSTQASFASIIPTTTEPVTVDGATPTSNRLVFTPNRTYTDLVFAGTPENQTADFRVYGWHKIHKVPSDTTSLTVLWVPFYLGTITATWGSTTGVAASTVLNTYLFADTLTISGNDATRLIVRSPTGNYIGYAQLTNSGFEKVTVDPDMTGTTTLLNIYYSCRD